MAIRWNATTKGFVFGTLTLLGVTAAILAYCKSCNAEDTAKEAHYTAKGAEQTAEEAKKEVVSVAELLNSVAGRVDDLVVEFKEHCDSTILQGVHQAAAKPVVAPAPKPAAKPAPKPEQPRPEAAAVRPVTQLVVNPQKQSGVVQQAATVAPTNVAVKVEGENRGATVVGSSVSAAQSAAGDNNTVVQQYAADAPTDVQVTVSGDNRGVVAVGANIHVEQTVLPDDYVSVTVTYRETVVRDPKAWKKYARRCKGR